MAGYTKLFNSILMSSVWEENADTRIVWVTLLALADQHGHVDGTVKSLARVARVSLDACQKALETFSGPDQDDRSGVDDGRRIRAEYGGWLIVNHAAYRERITIEERRERDKIRKRVRRASSRSPHSSTYVPDVAQADQKQIRSRSEQKQIRTTEKSVSSEPGGPVSEPVLTFPTIGTSGASWGLLPDQLLAWHTAYPGVDILTECRKALAWIDAAPERRKTARGMPRFLVGWLNRAVDSWRGRADQTTAPVRYGDKTTGNQEALQRFAARKA